MRFASNFIAATAVGFVAVLALTESACPDIVSRKEWNASDPKSVKDLAQNPPPYVVVHHSATSTCTTSDDCKKLVKILQTNHIDGNGWEDIGYSFLIGDDGTILEGRGWGIHGAHSIPYNARSLGICLLGNFVEDNPTEAQLEALQKLIDCSVENEKLATDYHLIAHNQTTATLCPGRNLYKQIEQWTHFDKTPE